MIDWDTEVLAHVQGVFGESVQYLPAEWSPIFTGQPLPITGVWDEAHVGVSALSDPEVNAVRPVLGVRIADFPVGYDPRNAQGDQFIARGLRYTVKDGKPDSHGWARLEAIRA